MLSIYSLTQPGKAGRKQTKKLKQRQAQPVSMVTVRCLLNLMWRGVA